MKLGFICEPSNNAYYRVIVPMRALEQRGHTVAWPATLDQDTPMGRLAQCDLVLCHRRVGRAKDLQRLSELGVAVAFDNDDNYAASDLSDGGRGLAGHRRNRELFRDMLKMAALADLATAPSEVLAEIYRRAGVENVAVLENHLERTMFGFGSTSPHDGVVVGWVAAEEHSVDLDHVPVVDALKRLLAAHDDLRVLTVGLRLPLHDDRYEHIVDVPYPRLLTAIGRMDIGIAPLADIPFNHSRSNVKLKEYASGAAAWLASPVGPYASAGEKQGGQLVANDDWFDALDGLLRAPRTRKRLAKRALRWAKQETIDRHVDRWEKAFMATIERRGERGALSA